MANYIEQLDEQIAALFAGWTALTTILALAIVILVAYPIVFAAEPDTHPLLLARQAAVSPVRNRYESAFYRSLDTPHGFPLRAGLNVKDPDTPRWTPGRDGDITDIWREVLRGGSTGSDGRAIPKGRIMTILGSDEVEEHDVSRLTKEIKIIGNHVRERSCVRVAIYLPNSIEYLLAAIACTYYGGTPILLPYNLPHRKVYEILNATGASGLICAAGTLPLEDVARSCDKLKLLTWVVEKTSRHMDWNGVPDFAADHLHVSVWHNVVEDKLAETSDEFGTDKTNVPSDVIAVWQLASIEATPEIVHFTQANLVAAIAGLIYALPNRQRLGASDIVLAASSFHVNYVFCQTMAALFSHASIAITSVAEPGVDFDLATRGVAPTVVIASVETMLNQHKKLSSQRVSIPQRLDKYLGSQALKAGKLRVQPSLFGLVAPPSHASSNPPGTLRLIFTSERIGAGTPVMSSDVLCDLRIFMHARVCYALTAAKVAGAIAQTNIFDYRRESGRGYSHFGVPLGGVEVKLSNRDDTALNGAEPQGELVVCGPAAIDGEVRLSTVAKIREDATLVLV